MKEIETMLSQNEYKIAMERKILINPQIFQKNKDVTCYRYIVKVHLALLGYVEALVHRRKFYVLWERTGYRQPCGAWECHKVEPKTELDKSDIDR
jgi:hypothetical protein